MYPLGASTKKRGVDSDSLIIFVSLQHEPIRLYRLASIPVIQIILMLCRLVFVHEIRNDLSLKQKSASLHAPRRQTHLASSNSPKSLENIGYCLYWCKYEPIRLA